MKTMKRVLALALAVVMVFALVSCSKKLSGTYSAEVDAIIVGGKTSYTFSGKNVTITLTGNSILGSKTTEYEGTYEITEAADGTMSITFTFEDAEADKYSKTHSFEELENSIKIGGIEYKKQ
ncbi:MAG: hypothetical protein IJY37_03195 [Clostridia bacterium]|nr:hypothetical protein [Clostridia bacterium]